MTTTFVGRALPSDGTCRWFDAVRTGTRVEQRMSQLTLSPRELRPVQPRCPVDVDHDGRAVGELAHAQIDDHGHLVVVGVLDVPPDDELRYLSVAAEHHDGHDIELRAVSLTATPAALGLPPIELLWGLDVRTNPGTGLPLYVPDYVRSLLAAAHAEHRQRRDHLTVRYPAEKQWQRHADTLERRQRPHGKLEHGPLGAVLSVR